MFQSGEFAIIEYSSKYTVDLTEEELEQCSSLYSNHYGFYSCGSPNGKGGSRVRMSPSYYRRFFMEDNYRVALAKSNGVVIGQAFYLRDDINSDTFTWVL